MDSIIPSSIGISNRSIGGDINRMLPEVLGAIFSWCNLDGYELSSLSMRVAPVNVSHVCSFWRNVALSEHQIWARFSIARFGKADIRKALLALDYWLPRAGVVPLTIRLGAVGPLVEDEGDARNIADMKLLLKRLIDMSDRWEYVDVFLFGVPELWPHPIWLSHMPHLKEFSWQMHPFRENTPGKHNIVNLTNSTMLQKCSIIGPYQLMIGDTVFIKLRDLELQIFASWPNHPSQWGSISILHSAPFLQSLNIHLERELVAPDDPETRPFVLNHLSKLSVISKDSRQFRSFFKFLEAPALQEVSMRLLTRDDGMDLTPLTAFTDFLSRSNPSIKSLDISEHPYDMRSLAASLPLLPALEELTVRGHVHSAIIETLAIDPKSTFRTCPLLRKFKMVMEVSTVDVGDVMRADRLIDMIYSRRSLPAHECSLKVVEIHVTTVPAGESILAAKNEDNRIQEMVSNGLSLKISR